MRGKPFPKELDMVSFQNKLPKYHYWLYEYESENSFNFYYLRSSDLCCRSFPDDKGWLYKQANWPEWEWVRPDTKEFVGLKGSLKSKKNKQDFSNKSKSQ